MVTDQTSLRGRPLERLRLAIGDGRFNKWAILIAVVGLVLLTHYHIVSPLRQLPSPIYGGDYYYQLGQTNHVASGGSPLHSSKPPPSHPQLPYPTAWTAAQCASCSTFWRLRITGRSSM